MANNTKAKVCPVCGKKIKENAAKTTCPQCGVVHHMQCWENNNGCYTKGCIAGGKHSIDIKEIARMQHSANGNNSAEGNAPVHNKPVQPSRSYDNAKNRNHSVPKQENSRAEAMPKTAVKQEPQGRTAPQDAGYTAQPSPRQPQSSGIYTGYLSNGRMDEFMQALIQKNIYYYDQKFSMMNMSGKSISWNWASFFLSAYWMMYRKMYLNTLFFVLISWAISFICIIPVVGWVIGGVMAIALWICMGLFGNAIYKKHIEKKYDECGELDYDRRKQESVVKGGTSAGAVILYIIISMLLNTVLMSLLTVLGLLSTLGLLGSMV